MQKSLHRIFFCFHYEIVQNQYIWFFCVCVGAKGIRSGRRMVDDNIALEESCVKVEQAASLNNEIYNLLPNSSPFHFRCYGSIGSTSVCVFIFSNRMQMKTYSKSAN